jgi:hypothetical protein
MSNSSISMFKDTVRYSGDSIFVKPICDFFQIDYENQLKRINKDPILSKLALKKTSITQFGDGFGRITLPKKGFIRWIQLINPQLVQVNLRDKLIEYQTSVFDFLYGYIEREEEIKVKYRRLYKLKRLKTRINTEIGKMEDDIQEYLQGKFGQTRIPFQGESTKLPNHEE